MRAILALLLTLWLTPAWAQVPMTGAGKGTPAAAYQGPGDLYGSATFWGSCARVYTGAQASTSTSLCDLVASTGGASVCTLRGSSTGFVDLGGTYCAGTDPASACAAASGGSCKVTKVYDQSGSGNHLNQGTLASMPPLVFSSSPTGTLPVINCDTGSVVLATTATFSQPVPITMSGVLIRTSGTTAGGAVGGSSNGFIGSGASNQAVVNDGTSLTASITDNNWYAIQGFITSGANGVINLNGSETTGTTSSTNFGSTIRFCRGAALQFNGRIVEGGVWFLSSNSTNRGDLNTNQHSAASGYNF